MNMHRLITSFLLVTSAALTALASDPASIPAGAIARKTELLFSDDFQGPERDRRWHRVVDTFEVKFGALKGTQTREKDMPSKDGKSIVRAHAAVYGLEVPTRDSVVECRIRFEGASMIDVEFDDRMYTGAHYGHLCRAQVRLNRVTLLDEREGSQNLMVRELRKDPVKNRAEITRLLAGRSASFPVRLEPGRWYHLVVETIGEEMRVSIDGKAAGYLKSSGIAHATKSKIEFGVGGKDGWFDDIKVWNAEPTNGLTR